MASRRDHQQLEELVQYLNLEEMRSFCTRHDLPLYILLERPDGSVHKSKDRDRKDLVLARILAFALDGKRLAPTLYAKHVIADEPLPSVITSRTRVHYGQYEKKNPLFVKKLEELTGGAFRLGMIARIVLRDFWIAGKAPSMKQFAEEWVRAEAAHTEPRPEGAYLADLARGIPREGWKKTRVQKAKEALAMLERLVS